MKEREELKRVREVYPKAEHVSDEEFRRRLATVSEWRKKELAPFKKEHPDFFKSKD